MRGAGTLKNTSTATLVSRSPQSILEHRYADYKEKSSLLHRPSPSPPPPPPLSLPTLTSHHYYHLPTPPPPVNSFLALFLL